jgi:hypothetical protein
MDEAPESVKTRRLLNRLSVSMLLDARNPEHTFGRSCHYPTAKRLEGRKDIVGKSLERDVR